MWMSRIVVLNHWANLYWNGSLNNKFENENKYSNCLLAVIFYSHDSTIWFYKNHARLFIRINIYPKNATIIFKYVCSCSVSNHTETKNRIQGNSETFYRQHTHTNICAELIIHQVSTFWRLFFQRIPVNDSHAQTWTVNMLQVRQSYEHKNWISSVYIQYILFTYCLLIVNTAESPAMQNGLSSRAMQSVTQKTITYLHKSHTRILSVKWHSSKSYECSWHFILIKTRDWIQFDPTNR